MTRRRVLLSWSSGKDSAWCLQRLAQDPRWEVIGLLTTFNTVADRVAMHAVRRELVERQAEATGLSLFSVELPWPCSNDEYEVAMRDALDRLKGRFDVVAFGDLFLEDVRAYRETQLKAWGFEPLFPLWRQDTTSLAREMIAAGLHAVLICVDPRQCASEFAGRPYDADLLEELPRSVDPCGENGEYHTFITDGPMFSNSIDVTVGERVKHDGFVFVDLHV